jgi:hypothetical protein
MKTRPCSSRLNRQASFPPGPWIVGLVILGLLVVSCATEVGNYTRLGKAYPAKAPDAAIEVFTNGLPSRAFDRVAIIDVRCESQAFMTPNLAHDALPMLLKQARLAGCDAIIEVNERVPQGNWTLETKVKNYSAVGIVYK